MATIAKETLNNQGQPITLCFGNAAPGGSPGVGGPDASRIGINLSGNWTGLVSFFGSYDGINFFPVSVTPFPFGTTTQTATANGSWFFDAVNYQSVRVVFTTLTTGFVAVTLAAAVDSSWQDAFLAASSRFVEQDTAGGTQNQITIAGQANRAWRCRKVSGGFSGVPASPVKVTISDGASTILWAEYVSAAQWTLNLPGDPGVANISGGGVVGTPGNSMVITVAAPGGGLGSSASAEMIAA
jgi:hypothetical protein